MFYGRPYYQRAVAALKLKLYHGPVELAGVPVVRVKIKVQINNYKHNN